MVFFDKMSLRFNKFGRSLLFNFLFWLCVFVLFIYFTKEIGVFSQSMFPVFWDKPYLTLGYVSLATSLVFSMFSLLGSYRLTRIIPGFIVIAFRIVFFIAWGFGLLFFLFDKPIEVFFSNNIDEVRTFWPSFSEIEIRFLVFYLLMCVLHFLMSNLFYKLTLSQSRRWILGLLNKPTEEERIFMFIDLKSSTTIAEKIGHKKFSHLVQDLFNELAIVDNFGGEIYQYLGDGAIVSWNVTDGLKNHNVLNAFFVFNTIVNNRKGYYERRYGVVPQFKAGAHVGKVMVLQVGQLKRDISYNGDTMNTAARIESLCNELKQSLLISVDLYNLLPKSKLYTIKSAGELPLKGKRKPVKIFSVKQISAI